MKFIIPEERVHEVISQIPLIDGSKPIYSWGDLPHLNKWVGKHPDTYPLIYQTSKDETQDTKRNLATTTWVAVIATRNENTSLFNDERWALSFRNVLNPLAERIAEGFTKCGFITWDRKVKLKRFGNYGENDEHFTVDIWDAILFEATIEINNRCRKQIIWT